MVLVVGAEKPCELWRVACRCLPMVQCTNTRLNIPAWFLWKWWKDPERGVAYIPPTPGWTSEHGFFGSGRKPQRGCLNCGITRLNIQAWFFWKLCKDHVSCSGLHLGAYTTPSPGWTSKHGFKIFISKGTVLLWSGYHQVRMLWWGDLVGIEKIMKFLI